MASNFLFSLLPFAVLLSAGVTIAAHYRHPPRPWLVYLFKPLTTILILVVALLPRTFLTEAYAGAIALGLVFSLAGDIFLMLPGNYFLHGLVSFLMGHLWYGYAFFSAALGAGILWPLVPLAIFGGIILRTLWPTLSKSLRVPVILYLIIIVGMTALAANRSMNIPSKATLSAAIGALLFLTSDTLLALDRFRKPFPLSRAAVLATYYAGQYLIAFSIPLGILPL